MTKEEFLRHLPHASGVIWFSLKDISLSPEVIDQAPLLKVISAFGAGYDTVNTEYAAKKGIWVTNTPDVVANATADIVLFLLLGSLRAAQFNLNYVRNGDWAAGKKRIWRGSLWQGAWHSWNGFDWDPPCSESSHRVRDEDPLPQSKTW